MIVNNVFFWKNQRSDITHESGWSWRSAENPIDWNDMQTSAMFKGNNKLMPFTCKNDSLPIFPIMIDECPFSVLRVQREEQMLSIAHPKTNPNSYVLRTWERRGSFPKMGLSMFNLTSPMKVNSVLFIFRESEWPRKKTPKGPFSYDLVPKARKSIKSYLRELFQSWLARVFLFRK